MSMGIKTRIGEVVWQKNLWNNSYKMNYWFKSNMDEWVHECVCVKDESYGFLVASVIKPQR